MSAISGSKSICRACWPMAIFTLSNKTWKNMRHIGMILLKGLLWPWYRGAYCQMPVHWNIRDLKMWFPCNPSNWHQTNLSYPTEHWPVTTTCLAVPAQSRYSLGLLPTLHRVASATRPRLLDISHTRGHNRSYTNYRARTANWSEKMSQPFYVIVF